MHFLCFQRKKNPFSLFITHSFHKGSACPTHIAIYIQYLSVYSQCIHSISFCLYTHFSYIQYLSIYSLFIHSISVYIPTLLYIQYLSISSQIAIHSIPIYLVVLCSISGNSTLLVVVHLSDTSLQPFAFFVSCRNRTIRTMGRTGNTATPCPARTEMPGTSST